MEVETDAVASAPRKQSESDKPHEQGAVRSDPLSSTPQDALQNKTKTQCKSQGSSNCNDIKTRETTINNNYNVVNGQNIVFGSVFNINQGKETIKKERQGSKTTHHCRKKFLRKLLAYPDKVDEDDLIIVSEYIDPDGLQNLGLHLGIENSQMNRINHNFQDKGIAEKVYQTLLLWKEQNTDEKQSAMLNILCDKLMLIGNNGGEGAVEALYKRHFGTKLYENSN